MRLSTPARLGKLGQLDTQQFLAQHWQKRPLLLRGAFADFACPVDKAALLALAGSPQVESRLVLERSRPAFRVEHGPFTKERWRKLPKTHWTVLVQDVDKHLSPVADLLEAFSFLPRWRIDDIMISYAARQGGVGPHYDNYDVFLLQGLGKRRWRLGPKPKAPQLLPGTELRVLENFSPTEEIVVEPGDLLYLPPHVAHHGIAETECITLSVGFRAPSQRELMFSWVEELLQRSADSQRYRDPDLRRVFHSGEIDKQAIAHLQALLRPALQLDATHFARWFGRHVTEPKPQLAKQRLPTTGPRTSPILKRALGSRWAFLSTSRHLSLFVDGVEWQLPRRLKPLVAALCDQSRVDVSRFKAVAASREFKTLQADLFERGLLQADRDVPLRRPPRRRK
ncbi:MAG TPA: cupin domain-containing protein [Polyangiaceae bacterium]|nr:cupin domain-containing protein [Polyangiaceae bacterium]